MPEIDDDKTKDYIVSPREGDGHPGAQKTNNAATGASAAGIRAISAQLIAFYFRAPIKAFFRTRFDYTSFARATNPHVQANETWTWRLSTPGILAHAIRQHGLGFIPNQVLPPLLANVTVGAILYTTYLQTLASMYEPANRQSKRVYPPPPWYSTASAGFVAGSVQSIAAAPLDALQVRFTTNAMLEGQYSNMWQYARRKLQEIGPRGVFAGWSLSFVKDSMGFAVFFATFESIKSQAYSSFVRRWYGEYKPRMKGLIRGNGWQVDSGGKPTIKPHYALEPTFLLVAGVGASIAQQVIQHPISRLQQEHYARLESLDYAAKVEQSNARMLRLYYCAYQKTHEQCKQLAGRSGGWRRWLYADLLYTTLRQVPSTSAGLIIFELVRRRYSTDDDIVRIQKDGFDILLT